MSTSADKMREAFEANWSREACTSEPPDTHSWKQFQAGVQWATPDPRHWQTVMEAAKEKSSTLDADCYNHVDAISLRAALRYFEERGMQ